MQSIQIRQHHPILPVTSLPGNLEPVVKKSKRRLSVIARDTGRRLFFPIFPKGVETICFFLLGVLAVSRIAIILTTHRKQVFQLVRDSNYTLNDLTFELAPGRGSPFNWPSSSSASQGSKRPKKKGSMRKLAQRRKPKFDEVDAYLAQKVMEVENEVVRVDHMKGLRSNHKHEDTGLVLIDVDQSGRARHVMFDLISNATEEHQFFLSSTPKSLYDASVTYRAAFNRSLPSNYEILGPTSFPTPPTALLPYLSLSLKTLHADQLFFESTAATEENRKGSIFILVISGGKMTAEFPFGDELVKEEANAVVDAMRSYEGIIGDLRIAIDVTAGSFPQLVPFEMTEHRTNAALHQRISGSGASWKFTEPSLKQVCAPWSRYRAHVPEEEPKEERIEVVGLDAPDFIHLAIPATDLCEHPHLVTSNPVFSYLDSQEGDFVIEHRQLRPVPILTPSKLSISSNILSPFLSMATAEKIKTEEELEAVHWEKKGGKRVAQWRGAPSSFSDASTHGEGQQSWFSMTPGLAHLETKWRLNLLRSLPLPKGMPLVVVPDFGRSEEGFQLEGANGADVWDEMGVIDVAMTSAPACADWAAHCSTLKSKLTIDPKPWSSADERYILVAEDESPRDVFLAASVVLHVGVTQQPWMLKAIPWFHYVPVQADFSDLPAVMAFFRKYPELAKQIGLQGRDFARQHMSLEQEKKEFLGLLLEYSRIWNEER